MIPQWIRAVKQSAAGLKNTRVMVSSAMLLALSVALNATVAVYLSASSRITFGLLAVAVCARLFGPSPAALIAALSDILVALMRPAGPYFPGYTLTAALSGLVYGLAFYQPKPPAKGVGAPYRKIFAALGALTASIGMTPSRVLLAQAAVSFVLNLGLNTLWTILLQGRALAAILPLRLATNAVGYLVYVTALFPLLHLLKRRF